MLSAKWFNFNKIANKKPIVLTSIFFAFSLIYCDDGLRPPEKIQKPGIDGIVTFKGNWMPEIKRAHVVMFRDPLNSSADFNPLNLVYVSEEIPLMSSRFAFNSESGKALLNNIRGGTYSYLAVAASTSELISLNRNDWFVIGVYVPDGDSSRAGKIEIPNDNIAENIIIICDFNLLPPQPPK